MADPEEQHILALFVRDRAGAIERVLGVLRRRAPGCTTVSVAATAEPGTVSVTISLANTAAVAERAVAHLSKLVDVVWATTTPATATDGNVLLSELALIRVACDAETRREVVDVAHLFAARPLEVTDTSVTLEASGSHETIENLLRLLRPLGIRELTRTGGVALRRGDSQLGERKEAVRATG
ncbi:MAG TPA: acetolactate synthase small subunit [Ktedonobacterales bacterium]|jgi:acetolactate synthase-1/3 small subunit|nr:acetolactate synthase small subunit [Ktedonobacterales bacterium]